LFTEKRRQAATIAEERLDNNIKLNTSMMSIGGNVFNKEIAARMLITPLTTKQLNENDKPDKMSFTTT